MTEQPTVCLPIREARWALALAEFAAKALSNPQKARESRRLENRLRLELDGYESATLAARRRWRQEFKARHPDQLRERQQEASRRYQERQRAKRGDAFPWARLGGLEVAERFTPTERRVVQALDADGETVRLGTVLFRAWPGERYLEKPTHKQTQKLRAHLARIRTKLAPLGWDVALLDGYGVRLVPPVRPAVVQALRAGRAS